MSYIPTPATIKEAPEASQPILETIRKQIGTVPNIFRLVSTSPAALTGLTGFQAALGKGCERAPHGVAVHAIGFGDLHLARQLVAGRKAAVGDAALDAVGNEAP